MQSFNIIYLSKPYTIQQSSQQLILWNIFMQNDPFRIPTDDEIAIAERKLGITFYNDYRCFFKIW